MALFAVTGAVCLCQGYAQDVFSCFVKQWLLVVHPGRQAMFTDETAQASLSNQCGDVLIWGCCLNVGIIIRLFICSFHTVQINPNLRQPQHPNFQKPPFEDWLCALLFSNYIKLHQITILINVSLFCYCRTMLRDIRNVISPQFYFLSGGIYPRRGFL